MLTSQLHITRFVHIVWKVEFDDFAYSPARNTEYTQRQRNLLAIVFFIY